MLHHVESLKIREVIFKKRLIAEVEALQENLKELLKNIEQDAPLNSMGQIQGRGSSIDVNTARYCEIRSIREQLEESNAK